MQNEINTCRVQSRIRYDQSLIMAAGACPRHNNFIICIILWYRGQAKPLQQYYRCGDLVGDLCSDGTLYIALIAFNHHDTSGLEPLPHLTRKCQIRHTPFPDSSRPKAGYYSMWDGEYIWEIPIWHTCELPKSWFLAHVFTYLPLWKTLNEGPANSLLQHSMDTSTVPINNFCPTTYQGHVHKPEVVLFGNWQGWVELRMTSFP